MTTSQTPLITSEKPLRTVKSFVRRQGRLTAGQQFALTEYSSDYLLNNKTPLDAPIVFGRSAELVLEIGFGNGASLAQMSANNPQINYIGIEVHTPGVGQLLTALKNQELTNVRVYCHDAVEILQNCIADNSLDRVQLFFPDPWHKKKHHKRRLVSETFLNLLHRKLKAGGVFHLATDWQDYAKWSLALLNNNVNWQNQSIDNTYCPRPEYRPLTKFEQRGLNLGHGVWDLLFETKKGIQS